MTKFRPISHVIFDMDGILLDTEPLYTEAIQNIVGKYGKKFTWDLKMRMMGSHRQDASKLLVQELELPISWLEYDQMIQEEYKIVLAKPEIMPDTEGVYRNAITLIAKKFGKMYRPEIVAKVTGTVERESARIAVEELKLPMRVEDFQMEFRNLAHQQFMRHSVPLMPGASKLVSHLVKHNIPVSVATSSSKDSFELKTSKHKEFFKVFDHIVCGGTDPDVKHGKPAPDIFLVSAARFPDKPSPDKCLVMEDAPNGVQAALSAGMQVVMLPDENIPLELKKDATITVSSLETIPLEKFGLPPMS